MYGADGLNLIDDDLGWAAPSTPSRPSALQRGSRGRRRGGPQGSRAAPRGPASSPSADAFPSLAESASATAAAPDPTYLRYICHVVKQSSRHLCRGNLQGNFQPVGWTNEVALPIKLLTAGFALFLSYLKFPSVLWTSTHIGLAEEGLKKQKWRSSLCFSQLLPLLSRAFACAVAGLHY